MNDLRGGLWDEPCEWDADNPCGVRGEGDEKKKNNAASIAQCALLHSLLPPACPILSGRKRWTEATD